MSPSLRRLVDLLGSRRAVVLAGAGCSTESGIPDYRGPDGGRRRRAPIQYGEFVRSPTARARYWARSAVGWPRMRSARPNAGHRALSALERGGRLTGVITQNVDGLHHAAGSRRVVELHGSLGRVRCLECDYAVERDAMQARLLAVNPEWARRVAGGGGGDGEGGAGSHGGLADRAASAPDGDAELADIPDDFTVPACPSCGGVLKPDVVFFGENVPRAVVDDAWSAFGEGEALLVVGSSLTVYSGRRFVYRARDRGVPIAVVNLGATRADEWAEVRVEARLGEALPELAAALGAGLTD